MVRGKKGAKAGRQGSLTVTVQRSGMRQGETKQESWWRPMMRISTGESYQSAGKETEARLRLTFSSLTDTPRSRQTISWTW